MLQINTEISWRSWQTKAEVKNIYILNENENVDSKNAFALIKRESGIHSSKMVDSVESLN